MLTVPPPDRTPAHRIQRLNHFAQLLVWLGAGIVAVAVQSGQGKSGDTCSLLVGDKVVESLYF
jgi:hypothetical protein